MKKIVLIAAMLLAFGLSANAQMIGATNNQGTYRPVGDNSGYRQTGSVLHFELGGYTHALGYGYQFNPYLRASLGVGLFVDYEFEDACLPIFAELRLSTPRQRFSLYADIKFGYNFIRDKDYPFVNALQLGLSFKKFSIGAGVVMFDHNKEIYFGPNFSFGWSFPLGDLHSSLF